MRRSRPDNTHENRMSPTHERQPLSPPEPAADDSMVLDWGLLSAAVEPSTAVASVCCVCGDANDAPLPSTSQVTSSPLSITRRGRGEGRGEGGGPGGPDESFIVLPADSTPALTESYFSLSRNLAGLDTRTYGQEAMGPHLDGEEPEEGRERSWASGPIGVSDSMVGSLLSQSRGTSIIGDGPAAGWTRTGFGAGSTMLESIVQISHAGLSDNIRRECLLHDLSKRRPARHLEGGGSFGGLEGGRGLEDLLGVASLSGDHRYPTLCWHCRASLLDRIDEDSRLADREALAYRDFVELLDSIADNDTDTANVGSFDEEGAPTDAAEERPSGPKATSGDTDGSGIPVDVPVYSTDSVGATFAKALDMAQQTSGQLRAELSSLEEQRRTLCVRGSQAWEALSELAWARTLLEEECREVLQISRELAEKAADLSERSALSEMFSIRHEEGFPTINGHRLNRVPDDKKRLQWNEINAAWGEAVLLVRCVSNAVNFRSRRFRLAPMNCASRVIELTIGKDADGAESASSVAQAHALFSTGGRNDQSSRRMFVAIRAFAASTSEVIAEVERRVLERRLSAGPGAGRSDGIGDGKSPFRQTGDSVGGVPISFLKNHGLWKPWLCQLVKNLEWAVAAASFLCVS